MERQKRRGGQEEESSRADRKQCEGRRELQGGTGENYTEAVVERWRRVEKEPPNPAPPCPNKPCSSNPRQKNSPCGKQVRLGWVIWFECGCTTQEHHTYSGERWAALHWCQWGRIWGWWFTDGSARSLWKAATGFLYITPVQDIVTPNVVYLPRIHMQRVQTHAIQNVKVSYNTERTQQW